MTTINRVVTINCFYHKFCILDTVFLFIFRFYLNFCLIFGFNLKWHFRSSLMAIQVLRKKKFFFGKSWICRVHINIKIKIDFNDNYYEPYFNGFCFIQSALDKINKNWMLTILTDILFFPSYSYVCTRNSDAACPVLPSSD